jgi:vancomycin permeability regulator SanA
VDEARGDARSGSGGSRRRRGPLSLVARVVLLLAVAALVYLVATFVQVLAASRADERGATDAVVVLGAAQYDGRPSPALQARLDHALELYRQGVAPVIVLTGANRPGDRFTEAYAGFRYLARAGVPHDDLLVVSDGERTWDSLLAARRVLEAEGIGTVTLVSSPYHDRRLQGIAGELGMQANVSPTSGASSMTDLARESAFVAVGQVVGYGRLLRLLR